MDPPRGLVLPLLLDTDISLYASQLLCAHPEWFPVVLGRVKSLNNEDFNSGCSADVPSIPQSHVQGCYLTP